MIETIFIFDRWTLKIHKSIEDKEMKKLREELRIRNGLIDGKPCND